MKEIVVLYRNELFNDSFDPCFKRVKFNGQGWPTAGGVGGGGGYSVVPCSLRLAGPLDEPVMSMRVFLLNGAFSSVAARVEFGEELQPGSSTSSCIGRPGRPFYFSDKTKNV